MLLQVNGFQKRIKDVTRKMMGLVAELAMKQAETMQLQQKSKTMTSDLQQSYTRMEQVKWIIHQRKALEGYIDK